MFSEKLGNFEAPVNPELWANVASQVGAASGAAAASGGLSLVAKAIIGISGAAVLTTGVILWKGSETEPTKAPKQEISQAPANSETPVKEPVIIPEPVSNINGSNQENSEVTVAPIVNSQNSQITPDPIVVVPDPVVILPSLPVITPANVVISPTTEEQGIAAVKAEREKEERIISQPNVAEQDEPVNTIDAVVVDPDIIRAEEIEIVFPNVFSPNGDRINDIYKIESSNVEFKSFEFVVYDQRGNVVMITKDANFEWTAMNPQTGMYLEKSVYAYVMIGETVDGVQYKKSGTITIE